MTAVFTGLGRRTTPVRAYNWGFVVYWAGWCFAFPLRMLGPHRCCAVLSAGRRPTPVELGLLSVPMAGAMATTLAPNLRRVDRRVAVVMVGAAAVNGVGEELLWRGTFLEEFPDNVLLGAVWPWVGFTAWHIAPQVVLPSRYGRGRFTAAAGLVGAVSALTAWRAHGVRGTLLPHVFTDACGVPTAEFRLGR